MKGLPIQNQAWVISYYPIRCIYIPICYLSILIFRGENICIIFVVGTLTSVQADMCHVGHEGLGSSDVRHL
jgi:hypothetical protein